MTGVAAIDQEYHPTILTYRENTAVVYRTPSGWCFRSFCAEDGNLLGGNGPYISQASAAQQAEISLQRDGRRL